MMRLKPVKLCKSSFKVIFASSMNSTSCNSTVFERTDHKHQQWFVLNFDISQCEYDHLCEGLTAAVCCAYR